MIREVHVKSILNRHKRRDPWFLDDYSINPYYGCSFGCIYCYTRGSKYGASGPVSIKVNAVDVLRRQLELRARKGQYGIIAISTSTEPYQVFEMEYGITRQILEVVEEYRFPVHIITKSNMVLKDMDVLRKIDERAILPEDLSGRPGRGAIITFSISTLDADVYRRLEPGAPSPVERLRAMEELSREGFLTGLAIIPALVGISDDEDSLREMMRKARDHGAHYVFVGALTLFGSGPHDSKTLFMKFVEENYPHLYPLYRKMYRSFQPGLKYRRSLEDMWKSLAAEYGLKTSILE